MARRFGGRGSFKRGQPKTKVWFQMGLTTTTVAGNSLTLLGTLNAAALAQRPFTILRTRLVLTFESDQAAVTERPFGLYGQIVVSDQAAAIGAIAIPDPGTVSGNADGDFYVH